MKKVLTFFLSMAFVLSLAACGGTAASSGGSASSEPAASAFASSAQPAASSEAAEPSADAASSAESETPAGEGGTLVAYFSWSGNTQQMAQIIAEQTGGDLFEIAPATPYTEDYDELLDIAQQEQAEEARPALAAEVENWDSYDTVFVGYPNWWGDAPMAVYTFLESYDWTGKTLVPFNTSASSGFGRSLEGIAQSAAGATVLEGLALTEGELPDAQDRVTEWLDGLGLHE